MSSKRIAREKETVKAMITLYCRQYHKTEKPLCAQCRELLDYGLRRLTLCPFQEGKTTCGKCPVHCYQPEMRRKIRKVMKMVGPKMIVYHPISALYHLLDGLRKKPLKKPR